MDYNFDGIKAKEAEKDTSFNMFIWGPSGAGKTTLAATAPKRMVWLQFDPGGTRTLNLDENHIVLDLSAETGGIITKLTNKNPLKIEDFLKANPDVRTLVLDSITTMSEIALTKSIQESKGATRQLPGIPAYGWRNTIMLQVVQQLLSTCKTYNVNLIIIAHEGAAEKDEVTGRLFISFVAGGNLQNLIPLRFDEVWYLEDSGKERRVYVRANPNKKPMKSRIFNTATGEYFVWKYDPATGKGITITDLISQRILTNKKLELPTSTPTT
jgi:hypothetical protein